MGWIGLHLGNVRIQSLQTTVGCNAFRRLATHSIRCRRMRCKAEPTCERIQIKTPLLAKPWKEFPSRTTSPKSPAPGEKRSNGQRVAVQ